MATHRGGVATYSWASTTDPREWFTATELAGTPGLPGTERGVHKAAKRDGWRSQKRTKGKGFEYHISSLPEIARTHLLRQHAATALKQPEQTVSEQAVQGALKRRETTLKAFNQQPRQKKDRARAREWVLLKVADLQHTQKIGATHAIEVFVDLFQGGELTIPEKHLAHMPRYEGHVSLDRATIYRWRTAYRAEGIAGLLDAYGNRRGDNAIERDADLKGIVLGALLQNPHITGRKIKAYIEARHPAHDVVSVRSLQRYIRAWREDNAQLWTYLTHPDAWKNVYLAAFGSQSESVTRLNQLWELDSTPADWMLSDGRHSAIACIDIYSRRLRYIVSRTSKASAICALMRRCVLEWGVPEAVRTDNGQDYVSEQLEEVLRGLQIGHELCIPFASEQKATVERSMRTMSHGILDLLPGFIGHNVAERKKIESRKAFSERIMTPGEVIEVSMSAAELQERLDQWCEHVYARDGHSGLDGQTPFEVATAWSGPVRRIHDERALDALLAPVAGTRTVGKKGVRLERHWYIAPELTERMGEVVRLKANEADMGRVYVYDLDGAFICVAQAPEITGISRAEAAAAAKHHQKQYLQRQAEEYRGYKRQIKENIAEAVLQHRIQQSERVTAMPNRGEAYTTPGLDAAGRAARAGDGPQTQALTEAEQRLQAEVRRDLSEPRVAEMPETSRTRFQRWVRLQRQARDGQALTDAEQRFVTSFAQQAECRVEHEMHSDFGLLVDGEAPEFSPAPVKKNARVRRA